MTTYEIESRDCLALSHEDILDIDTLVSAKLLPLPGTASRILGLLQNVNVSTTEISEAIGYDPVMASRVMRLANSPMYAMERSISTVQTAVSAVGIRSIYDIVMLGVASESFSNDMRSMQTGVSIWEHSVAVALASRALSHELELRGTEEAFICGLLHDIGKNLLFQSDQFRYTEIAGAQNEEIASRMESQIFGFNHSQVGFYVSTRWGLSDPISASILAHHHPQKAVEAFVITHIVNVADDLAAKKGMGLFLEEDGKLPASHSTETLRLTNAQMETVWETVESSLPEVLSTC